MKRFIIIFFAILSAMQLSAQTKEKGLFIEMNGGYGIVKVYNYGAPKTEHKGYMMLTPGLGYQINPLWALGFRATFEAGDHRQNNFYIPYVQYAFIRSNKFKVFTEGLVNIHDTKNWADGYTAVETGLDFGLAFALGNNLGLKIRYLYLGYSDTPNTHEGAVVGGGDLVFDAGLKRLQIGLQYTF